MKYYISRGGQQYGPYSLEDLQRMQAQAQVDANDLVWSEGMASWTPLSQVLQSTSGTTPTQSPVVAPQYPQQVSSPQPSAYPGAAAPVYNPMATVAFQMQYATWGSRVLAYLIDFILVFGVMIVLWIVAGGV